MNKDSEYWNERYNKGIDSGYGSSGTQAQLKLDRIQQYTKNIQSVVDIGCGDFQFGQKLLQGLGKVDYVGYDVSSIIISRNKELFPDYSWELLDNLDFVIVGDLLLCIDVLFHITDEKEYQKLINSLKNSWKKYLVLTAYSLPIPKRKLAPSASNFDANVFGTPILKELVEPENTQYSYLYIFEK